MDHSYQTLIEQWGYAAVFLGSMFEGEIVVITAGFLAQGGFLSLPLIMIISWMGAILSYEVLYFLGYYYGKDIVKIFPRLKAPADRASHLLVRYDTYFIIGVRFIYGIRIVSPIVIGYSGVTPLRFLFLNVLAGGLWSITIGLIGYFLGELILKFPTYLSIFILSGAIILGFIGYGIYWLRKQK